jgi:uncharacterized protein with GYD domain
MHSFISFFGLLTTVLTGYADFVLTNGGTAMATFITTIKFTEKGIQGIQDSAKRAAAFKAAAKTMGAKVSGQYWTLGPFDGVIVFDAPDDETATAAMLSLSSQGYVHTTTSRVFESAEMEKVVGILGKK